MILTGLSKLHLKGGKVPTCAIANGMQLSRKPTFFDINELECWLIAPQLAFQKDFSGTKGWPIQNYW